MAALYACQAAKVVISEVDALGCVYTKFIAFSRNKDLHERLRCMSRL
jgi:hypothetical protein